MAARTRHEYRGNLRISIDTETGKSKKIRLIACPACGREFPPGARRDVHFAKHDPEDFGLTPLNADRPGGGDDG